MAKKPATDAAKKSGRAKKADAGEPASPEGAASAATRTLDSTAAEPAGNPSAPPSAAAVVRLRWPARCVRALSLLTLVLMLALVGVLWFVSDDAWWGTLLTYSPRMLLLVAPAVLALASLLVHR